MTRIALTLSAVLLSVAVAAPAFASVLNVDQPSCGGGEKKDEKKPTSFR